MLEVLAPCGDINSFNVAVNNGANAVYLGLSNFNARIKADNFNFENIAEIVRQAHLRNVKVYLTVNTLIKDSEINDFINLIKVAVESKIDAFIIQDLGVAKIIKQNVKNAVMHASTQMGIHNLYGALVAESLGFKRVVLSREATLKDIKEIKENTNLEIEFFVQGALCVAFSGNCYYSAFLKAQSGNRGRCLQPCRYEYCGLKNDAKTKNGYLISPKDLCLLSNLKMLIDAGVTSFKIEGRLRRSGYVAVATNVYSNAIKNILDFKETKNNNYENLLKEVFNRGDYNKNSYLFNNKFGIINSKNQNHIGVEIGKVKSVEKFKDIFKVGIISIEPINKNDGLKFFKNGQEVLSAGVGNVEYKNKVHYIFTKVKPEVGMAVNRILNNELEEKYISNKATKLVDIDAIFLENNKAKVVLKCDGITVEAESESVLEKAKNFPLSEKECVEQLSKFNSEYFVAGSVNVKLDNVFIAKSVLNKLRRDALDCLEKAIIAKFEESNNMEFVENKTENVEFLKSKNYVCINDNVNIENLKNYKDFCVVYSPIEWDAEKIKSAIKKFNLDTNKIYVSLPIFANGEEVQHIVNVLKNLKIKNVISNNIWGLKLINDFNVVAGFNHNVINTIAYSVLKDLGVSDVILSMETSHKMLQNFEDACVYSFGTPTVMTFCHCINNTITGSTCDKCSYSNSLCLQNGDSKFKIRRYRILNCYFELLFNKTVNILEKHNKHKFVDLRNDTLDYFSGLFFNEIQ